MDQTEKKNEQDAREFDFRFVIKKDEEVKGENGVTNVVKSEVVASRLKVIAKGGDFGKKEKLVFDLQTGTLTVESELHDSLQETHKGPHVDGNVCHVKAIIHMQF